MPDVRELLALLARTTPDGCVTVGAADLARVVVPADALRDALEGPESARGCPVSHDPAPDHLLTVSDVAARLEITEKMVYRHAHEWPFTRKLGHRTLRFSEAGLRRWMARVA